MGTRLKQVSLAEASPEVKNIYKDFFGDRDPVASPELPPALPAIIGQPSPWFRICWCRRGIP